MSIASSRVVLVPAPRRAAQKLIAPERRILPVRRLPGNGLKAWEQAVRLGYEGVVMKDPASPYVGGQTLKCPKVKQPKYREQAEAPSDWLFHAKHHSDDPGQADSLAHGCVPRVGSSCASPGPGVRTSAPSTSGTSHPAGAPARPRQGRRR